MSGISTLSALFLQEVEGLPVKILDTRKTTARNQVLEKEAVRLGGCHNYRDGLYDWIMIKDNHVEACGSIDMAIDRVHEYFAKTNKSLPITIEYGNLVELQTVLDHGGVTRIMMDNFEIPILREAVACVNGQFETEASGSITLHNVRAYAETGVNYISSGALTQCWYARYEFEDYLLRRVTYEDSLLVGDGSTSLNKNNKNKSLKLVVVGVLSNNLPEVKSKGMSSRDYKLLSWDFLKN
jgi:nicotinate-nucleotide pyrophosphorylase